MVVQALLEMARALGDALGGFEPDLLSGDDCAVVAEQLARIEKACAAARARAGLRAADCGAHRRRGFHTPSEWLARTTGSSPGEARAALDTAAALGRCPDTQRALVAGELSLAQAGVIARSDAECPGIEAELLDLAGQSGLGELKDRARTRRVEAIDPAELHARQRSARTLRHWRNDLGMVCLAGELSPEVGVALANRLDAEADRLARAARGDGEGRAAHCADALVTLMAGRGRAQRADVVIVCDLFAYRRGHAHAGEVCHIIGGGPLPVSVVADMAGDAFVKAVLHDGVRIDSVAHFGRHIPAELRTALELGPLPAFDGVRCAEEAAGAATAWSGTTWTRWPTAGPPRSTTCVLAARPAAATRPSGTARRACWVVGGGGGSHRDEGRPSDGTPGSDPPVATVRRAPVAVQAVVGVVPPVHLGPRSAWPWRRSGSHGSAGAGAWRLDLSP